MERVLLLLTLLNVFTKSICSEDIKVTTSPTLTPAIAFNTNEEKLKTSEDTGILTAVENYLTEESSKKPEAQNNQNQMQGYIAQPMYPIYPAYNGGAYFYPTAIAPVKNEVKSYNYFSAILPVAQMGFEIIRNLFIYLLVRHFVLKVLKIFDLILDIREVLVTDELSNFLTKAALQAGLKVFAKLGLFLMGGAGLLVLGGIFTTLMCYLTPICTITFKGYDFNKALDKETMRSLMTPEKIASAAALVQDAIGKYQRLQREVGE